MINLHDLLGFVREVLFNLVVGELEDLELVGEGRLCRLCFCEVVDDLLIWVGLLDICIIEVDDGVAVWEGLALYAVVEDDLLLATCVDPLDLSVVADNLVDDL